MLSTDSVSQLDIFGHDDNSLGVNNAKVRRSSNTDEIGFARLLKSHDGRAPETEIGLEILSDFTNQLLERKLANQKFCALLTKDLTKSDRSRTMRFLHITSCGSTLTRCFRRQLLTWDFASGKFASSLLSSCY